jgi:hypothetical protein
MVERVMARLAEATEPPKPEGGVVAAMALDVISDRGWLNAASF